MISTLYVDDAVFKITLGPLMDEIKKMIDYFAGIKEKYENSSRPSRSVAVVFRDV